MRRCDWARTDLSILYHDQEWGVPQHDDHVLFEFLILEGAQAGLSWETILRKRENYRQAFNNFDPRKIAKYDSHKAAQLLSNPGIVRNRLKVAAAIQNASAFLQVQKEFGSFDAYVWAFVRGKSLRRKRGDSHVPASTKESEMLSRDLLRRGFKFVGPTICYAFMQAVGMVNDHDPNCFRYRQLSEPPAVAGG
jgi:DNA-3-methyladenine glycosylase I